MSKHVWSRAILPMIIGFLIMFGVIWLMFELMGITEFVWPILFPTFAITMGVFMITLICIGVICRAQGKYPDENQIVHPSHSMQMYSDDRITAGAVYVIPVYCPNCQKKLELDKVDWKDSGDLTCPNCFSTIQSSIREDL
ncbi:MAG: hypothetical protein KAR03_10160 [Candidatus Thorarchaeota archaeon]|nr:hypothetical protein [Candidatus Thorarchaeota archaeon]